MAPTAKSKLLTTEQLAELLGVPVRTLYSWRARGTGPRGIRVGRGLRFRVGDVEAWLDQHADPAEAAGADPRRA